jgi:carbon-monoxide dehydrogenase medium subunit
VIPAPFSFVRAGSVDEAVDALGEYGEDAKLLAGGHSLLPLMKLRLATPSVLVDVNDIGDLAEIRIDGDEVVVGGLARHCELVSSGVLREHVPLLSAAAETVGDPQVRHRGTLAGSLAHGDPASDLPAAVLALGGTIVVRGGSGVRSIAADDFFLGFLETALAPDEMITEVRLPSCTGAGWGFEKFNRRAQDWAIVGVAAVGGPRPGVALVNMAPTTVRATSVETALLAGASARDAAELADADTDPSADVNASAEFRRHLARVLVRRALDDVAARDRTAADGSTPAS